MTTNKLDIGTFITRSNKVHNSKYDYGKSVYTRASAKIKIICPRHGEFEQVAQDHMNGKGCKYCARNQPTKDELYESLHSLHPTLDFSLLNYTYDMNNKEKFQVICKVCDYTFSPNLDNLRNRKTGCPNCSGNLQKTTIDFINESKTLHGKLYSYKNCNYTNAHGIVSIFLYKT